MPSKYKSKLAKPIEKQDASLSYKAHWKPKPIKPRCTNCGRIDLINSNYSKCYCGGTFQTYGQKNE